MRGFLRSSVFTVGSLILFALVSWALAKQIVKKYTVNQDVIRLQQKAQKLEQENKEIEQLLTYLNSTAFVEKEARLKKGLAAPDEHVVVIQNLTEEGAKKKENVTQKDTRSNPKKWFDYFLRVQ